jgi:S-adenosylmethionine:tRNA ribosyltransferase-isomerase
MSEIQRYDYHCPGELIAQEPLARRTDARLLVVDRSRNSLAHKHVRDLPAILRPGDCLVLNNSRVVPARLVGFRTASGGKWEGLLIEADEGGLWRVLGKTRGHLTEGESITLLDCQGREDVRLTLAVKQPGGVWIVRPETDESTDALLDRVGRVPLPPYIRKGEMVPSDRENYQTVFASRPGSIAAPTAGLHFTQALLEQLNESGVASTHVTLHVGLGTFRPVATDNLADHVMHRESGEVGAETVETIRECRARGGRVVAVGSTSVRLLETAASDGQLKPFRGETDLFIRPPYEFRAVDAMMTNFHLPRTTLLVLVYTFGGEELMRRAYDEAIREEYRLYSYGDAMLIL